MLFCFILNVFLTFYNIQTRIWIEIAYARIALCLLQWQNIMFKRSGPWRSSSHIFCCIVDDKAKDHSLKFVNRNHQNDHQIVRHQNDCYFETLKNVLPLPVLYNCIILQMKILNIGFSTPKLQKTDRTRDTVSP